MTAQKNFTGKSGPSSILTIDDDANVRLSIKMFLEDLGYLVLEAADGDMGLDLFYQHHPDLILLDLRMPGISGLEFLQQVRESNIDTPVIVVSGTGKVADVIEALRQGASDFLLKPILDLPVLQHSVEKALQQSQLERENIAYRDHLEEIVSQRTATLERTYLQLTASENKYRSIYENLQDIYYETTLEGTLLEISPSLEKSSNYKRDELLGKNVWDYYAYPQQRDDLIREILANTRIDDFEVVLMDKNGQEIFYSINAQLHRDSSGKPTHISGIMRNISERKAAEEALRATNQTFKALFDAAPLAILAIDTELRITLWNQAAEKLFGWKAHEVIGKPYPLAASGKEEESRYNLYKALRGDNFSGLEVSRQHKNGDLIDISASTSPLQDNAGTIRGVIIILEDIREKRRLRSEADRYSRLASLGELAAGVAHEINNPNGLILLNLPTVRDFVMDALNLQQELLKEQADLKLGGLKPERAVEAFPQLMNEMDDSSRRIKQIVEDLKEFAGQGSISQDEMFDLNSSANAAIRLTNNHIRKATVHFSSQLSDNLLPLKGSAQRIEQVIINLLVNACEALTNPEQKIRLETGRDSQTQEIYLCILDEGCGIAEDKLPHITDPFFTTRRKSGGTGLGLSVSARIVNEHNGRLVYSSKLGQGTSACIYFPEPQQGEQ